MNVYERVAKYYGRYNGGKCIIGYSYFGREIFAFHCGSEYGKQFISVAGVHAREWICSLLSLKFIEEGAHSGGWVIPLANPDGAIIAQTVNPMWKANGRGVDINCNFGADWGTGAKNVRVRGPENCIGDYPFSEAETAALVRFTKRICPNFTVSFHTKGGEVYWEYGGNGDFMGAELISEYTGYTPKIIKGSAGGYKDWCIQSLKIPSFTVECGRDSLSHPISKLGKISECFGLLRYLSQNYSPKKLP